MWRPQFSVQDTELDNSNIITIGGQGIVIGDSSSSKKALPPGTKRNVFNGYEEVAVPPVNPGKLLPDERLVEVSDLDGWVQTAFKGYKTLNRIQSRIFEVCVSASACCSFVKWHCHLLPGHCGTKPRA
jgi:hypothetical protein